MRRLTGVVLACLLGAVGAAGQSSLSTTANGMAPGTWAPLTTTGFNNGAVLHPSGGGSLIEFTSRSVWNSIAKKVLIVGGSHPGSAAADCAATALVGYTDSTNTWSAALPNPCPTFDNSTGIGSINLVHPYDHQTIVDSTGDLYHRQYFSGRVMKFGQVSQAWSQCSAYNTSGSSTSWANINLFQAAGSLVYHKARNSLLMLDGDWGLYELSLAAGNCTGQWTLLASGNGGGGGPQQLSGQGSYDNEGGYSSLCHCVIIGGGNGTTKLYKVAANGAITTVAAAPVAMDIPQQGGGTIFVSDPATGHFLLWSSTNAGTTMYDYNPVTNVWATISRTSPIFPALDGGVYNTVAIPIVDYNVTMFVQTVSGPTPTGQVYLYKHSALTADMSYATRCDAPGVFQCVGVDASSEIAGTYGDIKGTIPGDGGAVPVIDTTTFSSGGGSLKCGFTTTGGTSKCGDAFFSFTNNITGPGTTRLYFGGPGDAGIVGSDLYVQWRQRFDNNYPLSGQYKLINFGGGDGQACTSGTSASCAQTAPTTGTGAVSSCNALETVTQNTQNRGFIQLYNSCTGSASHGPFDPFEQPFGGSDFKLQNGMPSPFCLYSKMPVNSLPNNNCFDFFPNEWMTFQIHVLLGTFTNGEYANSHVDLWACREADTTCTQVFNWGPYNLTSSGGGFTHLRYGKFWPTGYDTTGAVLAPATTWFDEFIVSTARIPDPGQSAAPAGTPTVSLSPSSLIFGNQTLQSASAAQNITLTNTGAGALSVVSVAKAGANAADFSITSNTCGSSLAVSASCVVGVAFSPTFGGTRSASIVFTTDASTSPDSVTLTGTGALRTIFGSGKLLGSGKVNP